MEYPPILLNDHKGQPSASAPSDSCASDVTLSDDQLPLLRSNHGRDSSNATSASAPTKVNHGRGKIALSDELNGDDDDEFVKDDDLLDEEERIALMQVDRERYQQSLGEAVGTNRLTLRVHGKRTSPARGCLVFSLAAVTILLAVPLLLWLSTTSGFSSTYSPQHSILSSADEAIGASGWFPHQFSNGRGKGKGKAGDSETMEVTLPFLNKDRWSSKITKFAASSNDEAGNWGLKHASPAFSKVNRAFTGWGTVGEALAAFPHPSSLAPTMQPRSSSAKSEDEVDQRFIEALRTQSPKSSLRQLNMDMLFNGTLYARGADINWSEDDPDVGVFSYVDPATQDLIIQDVTHARKEKTGTGEVAKGGGKVTLVSGSDVKDKKGNRIQFDEYIISPDMRYVLFLSDRVKQWRYSSHYNVWLFDVAAKKAAAISADGVGKLSMPPTISNVKFAPSSAPRGSPARTPPSLAFVSQNDIYFLPSPDHAPVRITNSGATEIFNGVPDWVYEEEVFSSDSAMWFSPDGTKLAYLSFDERDVPTFDFPIYNPSHWFPAQTTPYTEKTKMKYPKPGYPNPVVSAHVVDVGDIKEISAEQGAPSYNQISAAKLELHSPDPLVSAFAMDLDVDNALAGSREKRSARLVTEVAWIGNSDLLLRESNRASDRARVLHFDLNKVRNVNSSSEAHLVGDVVRRISTVKENGWIEVAQTIRPLGNTGAYLEVMPTAQGYRQLALFASATSADPVFLTQGKWEIDGNIKHVDIERKRVYFIAAHPLPSERHLFYVALPDAKQLSTYRAQDPIPLTDTSTGGWNTVSFDPKGAYYLLSSQSPDDPPARRVIGVDDRAFNYVLEDNRALRRISAEYVMPTKLYYNITTPSGANISVSELRPHDFDASGRNSYPVLVNVYGGPNSQMVQQKWQRSDWHQYVACEMGYLVATIDGRGTGFKGRLNRNPVTTRLGDVESLDVTEAAHQLSRLPYVDERRIGIWGWSYGGYLTSKVIERDSGVFNLGMSVAPVTSWRFYDSIYTERYMKLPTDNMQGYEKSGLHATDGFKHSHFLIAQGSADDNVHFQNSAHLLDMLTGAKVRGFRFRMFTDSDHSISMRGAYQELHEYLLSFLSEKWGPGGKRRFRLKDT